MCGFNPMFEATGTPAKKEEKKETKPAKPPVTKFFDDTHKKPKGGQGIAISGQETVSSLPIASAA